MNMTKKKEIKKLAKALRKKAGVEFIESFRVAKWFYNGCEFGDNMPNCVDIEIHDFTNASGYLEFYERYFINGIPTNEIW